MVNPKLLIFSSHHVVFKEARLINNISTRNAVCVISGRHLIDSSLDLDFQSLPSHTRLTRNVQTVTLDFEAAMGKAATEVFHSISTGLGLDLHGLKCRNLVYKERTHLMKKFAHIFFNFYHSHVSIMDLFFKG